MPGRDALGNHFERSPIMTSRTSLQQAPDPHHLLEHSIASVREALSGLRFGSVSLTVHEGRVVQIDVTEKRRLLPN